MACEKCWADAFTRHVFNGGSQADHYRNLLEERKDNPCTPEEQKNGYERPKLGLDKYGST